MTSIDAALLDLGRLDQLASGDTVLHRLDSRAKVLVTIGFIVSVVSFGRYELSALVPLFIFPAVMIALGNLPASYLLKRVAVVAPFLLLVGLPNALFDRAAVLPLGPLAITSGWISCLSILVRGTLTVSAGLILVALTGLPAICNALEKLGVPRAVTVQLLFLYRYLFVLAEEGRQASRARELRSLGNKGRGIASYATLLGHLLMRTWQRAERIHMAMLARGFNGRFAARADTAFGVGEFAFVAGWCLLFIVLRHHNFSQSLGSLLTRYLP
jgi:cobalt/nickel transport system permease protein